ncbi:Afadin and alpha-actinin-binding-domain-containing protein [Radiomyces spectabilis]|uniref:Afadin and alpha-actinin-binding-domain-containing protein n=1 Tax=Radiomyces spectabilis TaxID=64574 RepID=UPI002220F1C9|nr:Afadin and alpha-actinin-binding-domain-containing protein [Radiomyces spectabilis]KAI8372837.1 Afadin and alpha-actinin-binding-domain-containing protein [Radiomyces spectabilis]
MFVVKFFWEQDALCQSWTVSMDTLLQDTLADLGYTVECLCIVHRLHYLPSFCFTSTFEPPLSSTEQPDNYVDEPIPATTFCTTDNFASSANYINLLLTARGYPVPLVFKSDQVEDACKIINCLHQLLQDGKHSADERQDLHDTIDRLKQDQEQLQLRLDKCNHQLQAKERENIQLKAKIESTGQELKKEIQQSRNIREELSKAKNNMQYMKAQYAHETRRHEQEHAKTRERLLKLMDEKSRVVVGLLEMKEPMPNVTARIHGHDELVEQRIMYSDLLNKSSEREREARTESEEFRTCLIEIYTAVRRLLERQIQNYDETFPQMSEEKNLAEEVGKFRLPLNFGSKEAIQHVHDLLDRLQEEWDREVKDRQLITADDIMEKDQTIHELEQQIEDLIEVLEHTQKEKDDAAKIHMKYANGGFFDTLAPVYSARLEISDSESSVLEDEEEEEAKWMKRQREARQERQQVTELALKLGQERAKLSAERWAFKEMKRELQLQEVLAGLPSSPERPSPEPPTSSDLSASPQRPASVRRTHFSPLLTSRRTSALPADSGRAHKRLKSWLGHAPSTHF